MIELKYYIKAKNTGDDLVGTMKLMFVDMPNIKDSWLPCESQILNKDEYPDLWNLLSDSPWGYKTIEHSLSKWYNPFTWGKVRCEIVKLDVIRVPDMRWHAPRFL